jgi:hypothetical protein
MKLLSAAAPTRGGARRIPSNRPKAIPAEYPRKLEATIRATGNDAEWALKPLPTSAMLRRGNSERGATRPEAFRFHTNRTTLARSCCLVAAKGLSMPLFHGRGVPRETAGALALIVVALTLFAVRGYYSALGCDGGWYSYPGLELAQRGTLGGNLCGPADQANLPGISACYGFATHPSIRVFYTALAFRCLSSSIYTIRLLSLLEWAMLIAAMYFAIACCVDEPIWRLPLLAIFINDKTVLLEAAGDYRPDIAVAVVAVLLIVLAHKRQTTTTVTCMLALSVIISLVHSTAVVPFIGVLAYVATIRYTTARHIAAALRLPIAMMVAFGLPFLGGGQVLFSTLLSPCTPDSGGSRLGNEVRAMWHAGLGPMVTKEVSRWSVYFFVTNLAALLVLAVGVGLVIRNGRSYLARSLQVRALLIAITSMIMVLFVLDPHRTDVHAIPVAPFFYLLLATQVERAAKLRGLWRHSLLAIAVVAGGFSSALTAKLWIQGHASGYNVRSIRELLRNVSGATSSKTVILGPVEIFPFLTTNGKYLIVDNARSGENLEALGGVLPLVTHVVLNGDYESYGWPDKFQRVISGYSLERVAGIRGVRDCLAVYRLRQRDSPQLE